MNVIELDKMRPHLTIKGKKSVHVIPLSVFEDIIDGKMKLTDIEEVDDIIPTILSEFLKWAT